MNSLDLISIAIFASIWLFPLALAVRWEMRVKRLSIDLKTQRNEIQ